jgi:hypothetical protein
MSIIDYAQHLIRLESLLRSCHDLCLDRRYGQAAVEAIQIRAEARLLELTLAEMNMRAQQEEVRRKP